MFNPSYVGNPCDLTGVQGFFWGWSFSSYRNFKLIGTAVGRVDDTVVASVAASKNTPESHVSAHADLTPAGHAMTGMSRRDSLTKREWISTARVGKMLFRLKVQGKQARRRPTKLNAG